MASPTNRRRSKEGSQENSPQVPTVDGSTAETLMIFKHTGQQISQAEFFQRMIQIVELEQESENKVIHSQITSLACFKTPIKLVGLQDGHAPVHDAPMAEVKQFPSKGRP